MQMTGKNNRILDLYARLMNGETISKRECAGKYGVNEKSVQRDFNDIRSYFAMKLSEEGCALCFQTISALPAVIDQHLATAFLA